jgi:hypothetical protein
VALASDVGEGPADLLVASLQDEVTHLHRILGAPGDDLIFLDDA